MKKATLIVSTGITAVAFAYTPMSNVKGSSMYRGIYAIICGVERKERDYACEILR